MVQLSPDGAVSILQPLVVFIFGLAIYTIVVYNLYKFVATRDIFNLNLRQYNRFQNPTPFKIFAVILYFIEYVLFFPLFLMVWFVAFSVIMIAVSQSQSISMILLLSMAIISSIRIVSYYKQALAKDIAKLIPFALIAVVLMEDITTIFSVDRAWELIKQIPSMVDILIYYFVFVIALEVLLRVMYSIAHALSNRDTNI
jgi:hypothetical protein